jgi:AraC-like DNA-binding protein
LATIIFPVIRDSEQRLPYLLNGAATDFAIEHLVRPGGLDSGWWLQTRSGSGRVLAGDLDATVGPGQAVWIMPGQPHELTADTKGWVVDWLSISGQGLEQLTMASEIFVRSTVVQLTDTAKSKELIESIFETSNDLSPSANRQRSALVYAFLLEIEKNSNVKAISSTAQREQRLKPVLDYIAAHYNESIDLGTLAQIMEITPQHLCTMFRKSMEMRIFEYINLTRIQTSKAQLIEKPDEPVRDIAHSCGFDDVSYFCSIFKRFEKMTPGEYRRSFAGQT